MALGLLPGSCPGAFQPEQGNMPCSHFCVQILRLCTLMSLHQDIKIGLDKLGWLSMLCANKHSIVWQHSSPCPSPLCIVSNKSQWFPDLKALQMHYTSDQCRNGCSQAALLGLGSAGKRPCRYTCKLNSSLVHSTEKHGWNRTQRKRPRPGRRRGGSPQEEQCLEEAQRSLAPFNFSSDDLTHALENTRIGPE